MFNRKKYTLSVKEMLEMENWLESECIPKIGEVSSEEALSSMLKLKVEYVDPENLSEHVEAELIPTTDSDFNGLIRVNTACKGMSFAYMHEIVHYIYDIGIGKKVDRVYTRMEKGHTKDKHEQKINYMAAALSIQYDKIVAKLQDYDTSRPKMDEFKFINELCQEFRQSKSVIIRRIQEVRRLQLYKERIQH